MSRLKLFVLIGFGLMFLAGLEVGRAHTSLASIKSDYHQLVSRFGHTLPPPSTTQPTKAEPEHKLFGEIPLSAEQDEQVHKIYHEAHAKTDAMSRQFRDLDRQRDEDIIAILDPTQKLEYDEIQQERDARVNELRAQIGTIMAKASDEVRALLLPDQQKKFDEVKKKFDHHGPGGQPRHGGPGHRPHGEPETAPSAPDNAPAR